MDNNKNLEQVEIDKLIEHLLEGKHEVYEEKAQEFLKSAKERFLKNQFEQAIILLTRGIEFSYKNQLESFVCKCYEDKMYKAIIHIYTNVPKFELCSTECLLKIALSYAKTENGSWSLFGSSFHLDEAFEIFKNIKNACHPIYIKELGDIFLSYERFNDAILIYSMLIDCNVSFTDLELQYACALGYINRNDFNSAFLVYREVVQIERKQKYLQALISVLSEKQFFDEAKIICMENAHDASLWIYLSDIFLKNGKLADSIYALINAIKLEPFSIRYLKELSYVYERSKEYSKAIETWERIHKIEPHSAYALTRIAELNLKAGHNSIAIKYYNLALEEEPGYITAVCELAKVYMTLGDFDNAINLFETAYSDSYSLELAECYYKKGEFDKAIDICLKNYDYNIKNNKDPGMLSIRDLTSIYLRCGKYEKARELFLHESSYILSHLPSVHTEYLEGVTKMLSENDLAFFLKHVLDFDDHYEIIADTRLCSFLNSISDNLKDISTYAILKKIKKGLYQLILNVNYLLAQLKIEPMLVKQPIVHYSKIDGLKYFFNSIGPNNTIRLRLSNSIYMNDPQEGNVLLKCLSENQCKGNNLFYDIVDEIQSRYISEMIPSEVYLLSFSMYKDVLPMWGMYGEKGEGCCIHIEPSSLDDCDLYKILYIDDSGNISGNGTETIQTIINSLNEINSLLNVLPQDEQYIIKSEILPHIIKAVDKIRFLFKIMDYEYEQEIRLINFKKIDSPELEKDDPFKVFPPRVHINIDTLLRYEEIVLGSRVKDPQNYVPWLLNSGLTKKVSVSKVRYR